MGDGFLELRRVRDISEGGLGILVPHHFEGCEIQKEVRFILTLSGERPFIGKGIIRHTSVSESSFGVQFTEISKEGLAKLREYVKRRVAEGGLV